MLFDTSLFLCVFFYLFQSLVQPLVPSIDKLMYHSTCFLQRGLARPKFFLLGNTDISSVTASLSFHGMLATRSAEDTSALITPCLCNEHPRQRECLGVSEEDDVELSVLIASHWEKQNKRR